MSAASQPSVNEASAPLVATLLRDARMLRLGVSRDVSGAVLVDAGIAAPGGIEAGRRIAEICLGGLGRVSLVPSDGAWPWLVSVHTAAPVLACLGSQYAGWALEHKEGVSRYFALGSGPARSLAVKEPLFAELDYRDRAHETTLVIEVDRAPPAALLRRVAGDCGVPPDRLTVIMTPTTSLAGAVQIAARSLEVALHKAHSLRFPLGQIIDGAGEAPLPPPSPDLVEAMGRTNDAILYGGSVQLFVGGDEALAKTLAEQLPSSASRDYGKPFAETFSAYGRDFYKIDPLLFSPGLVQVTALATGRSFRSGRHDPALLARSFGLVSS
jgi:methenyltetrahydromethanopterin cyclohydrolase